MAGNTQVGADHHAPPVTRILTEFVAQPPSRGWSDTVDHEMHRTFLNWPGCAAGLIFGRAAEDEYADEIVNRADVVALRRKVVATVDDAIDEASADVTAVLKDGRRVHVFVEHAIGSLQRPMSDANLEAKFKGMADPVLGAPRVSSLIEACWALGDAADVRELAALAVPRTAL